MSLILNKWETWRKCRFHIASTVMVISHVMVEKFSINIIPGVIHTSFVHCQQPSDNGFGFLDLLLVLSIALATAKSVEWVGILLDHGASSYRVTVCICFCLFNSFYHVFLALYFCGPRKFCYYVSFPSDFFSSFNIEWYFFSCGQMVASTTIFL